jgi:hypothetical protein
VGVAGAIAVAVNGRALFGPRGRGGGAATADEPRRADKADREESREARAARLRSEAAAACGALDWRKCENKLEHARRIDPSGESDRAVQRLREELRAANPGSPEPATRSE